MYQGDGTEIEIGDGDGTIARDGVGTELPILPLLSLYLVFKMV